MSMKKTDLEKRLAKKLDGRMKSSGVPARYGPGSAAAAGTTDGEEAVAPAHDTPAKLVAVACRLPADLANRLRERAARHEGGANALMAQALEHWLQANPAA